MSNPVWLRVTEINDWTLMTRSWDDRPGVEWVLTPRGSNDGPVLKFRTAESATDYAARHRADHSHLRGE